MTLKKQLNVLPQETSVQIVEGGKIKYEGLVRDARDSCLRGVLDASSFVSKSIPVVSGKLKIVIKPNKVKNVNFKEDI